MTQEIEPSTNRMEVAVPQPSPLNLSEHIYERVKVSRIVERPIAVNLIAEVTEHVVELALREALEEMGASEFSLTYNSAYNHLSPRYGRNDQGCEFVLKVGGETRIKIEVEQRTSGYTRKEDYRLEVRDKLSAVLGGCAFYLFFTGFSEESLDELRSWAREDGIEIITAPPLPYTKLDDGDYKFDAVKVLKWANSCFQLPKEAFVLQLPSVLAFQEEDDST